MQECVLALYRSPERLPQMRALLRPHDCTAACYDL
jgi:hypothetical protein